MPRPKKSLDEKIIEAGLFMLASRKNELTIEDIEKYSTKISKNSWNKLAVNKSFGIEFFRKFGKKINWGDRRLYNNRQEIFTEELIDLFEDKILWSFMNFLDEKLITKYHYHFDLNKYSWEFYRNNEKKLSKEFLIKFEENLNWNDVSRYVDKEDYEYFAAKLDWNAVSENPKYLELEGVKKFENYLNFERLFSSILYHQEFFKDTNPESFYIRYLPKIANSQIIHYINMTEAIFKRIEDLGFKIEPDALRFSNLNEMQLSFIKYLENITKNSNLNRLYANILNSAKLSDESIDYLLSVTSTIFRSRGYEFGNIIINGRNDQAFAEKYNQYFSTSTWQIFAINGKFTREFYIENSSLFDFNIIYACGYKNNPWVDEEFTDEFKLFLMLNNIDLDKLPKIKKERTKNESETIDFLF